MHEFRRSIVAVITALTFLFNIERLDIGSEVNAIDISSFVYVLAFLMVGGGLVLAIVPSSRGWRGATAGFWLAAYLAGKLFLFHDHPFWGGIHTYLTVTELALLAAVFVLTTRVAGGLREFEQAVATLTLTEVSRKVRPVEDAHDEIRDRLLLSRRHHHPMSVLVFGVGEAAFAGARHRIIAEVQRAMANRFVVARLANAIVRSVRRTDLPLEQARDGRFVVLCPQTDAAGAEITVRHVQKAVRAELGLDLNAGVATFPADALTFDELLRHAEAQIRGAEPVPALALDAGRADQGVS
jgi:hypothetical protein